MTATSMLPPLPVGDPDATVAWVRTHLGDLCQDEVRASPLFRGGQSRADAALAAFDVTAYAARRNEVWPRERRGASALSPYIRYGLLPLPRVWEHVEGGPPRDVAKYRDELLWQEYGRHLYARLGSALGHPLRGLPPPVRRSRPEQAWDRTMACMDLAVGALEVDGWLVNQTRMWLSSQWSVRHGLDWREGEDAFFTHLLDGSRAANRTGWQWTVGTGTGKRYGFSRWQVEKRAPGLCGTCALRDACPIEGWPEAGQQAEPIPTDPLVRRDPDPGATAGPDDVVESDPPPEAVWVTAESLGAADPAMAARPDLPVVFTFDAPLLAALRLSGKRLVFLAETLGEIGERHDLRVHRGDPVAALEGRRVAVTFAPVPGFRRRLPRVQVAALHPWPWLRRPHGGSVQSFTAWRKALSR